MKLLGANITRKARDKQWGFTEASFPRAHKGNDRGVLICHGLGGSPANMRCLYDAAVMMGYSAVMPLLSGHAGTLGTMAEHGYKDWQKDVDEALKKLLDMGSNRICLCGLSMGALLMADLAARNCGDSRIDSLMLICPAVKFRGYLNTTRRLAALMPFVQTADSFEHTGTEIYCGTASHKLNDVMKLSRLVLKEADSITQRMLIVEAGDDNRVDPETYRMLSKLFPNSEHVFIGDAPHGITYSPKAEEVTEVFRDFLAAAENARD